MSWRTRSIPTSGSSEDGTIVAYSSQIEMGQGIHTGLATIVAEELDADFDSVRVVNAANGGGPPRDVYGNPDTGGAFQITGASNSTKGYWARYRLVAAQARARLAAAAAERWDVPPRRARGRPRYGAPRERQAGEVRASSRRAPSSSGSRRRRAEGPGGLRLIGGEGRLRVDAVPKILGTTRLHDRRERARHADRGRAPPAAVRREGSPGSTTQAALAEPGVAAVVPIEEGVAVVGETIVDAQRGLRALTVEWDDTDAERRSSAELLAEHLRLLESRRGGRGRRRRRQRRGVVLADAPTVVDGMYALPYLAHAAMEPNNAACRMRKEGVLEVWASTESAEDTRMSAALRPAASSMEQVEVHVTFAGGSFGLHSELRATTPRPRPCRSRGRSTGSIRSRSSRSARRTSRAATSARWPSTACVPQPTQPAG